MAKKDLSHAKGLSALFQGPPAKVEEKQPVVNKTKPKAKPPVKQEKTVVAKTTKPKSKPVVKKVKEKPKPNPVADKTTSSTNTFSVDLEGLRKKGAEYTGIRLRRELFLRLQAIAEKEKLKSTNSLISTILEAYCNGYEGA